MKVAKRRSTALQDAFEFTCYDAVQTAGEPISAKAAASKINADWVLVRRVLDRLVRQKALSRTKISAAWHYHL